MMSIATSNPLDNSPRRTKVVYNVRNVCNGGRSKEQGKGKDRGRGNPPAAESLIVIPTQSEWSFGFAVINSH